MTRDAKIHCAKVYLAQSRHFTKRARAFSFLLLDLAANLRKEASVNEVPASNQMDMFA